MDMSFDPKPHIFDEVLSGSQEFKQVVNLCTNKLTWPYPKSPGGRDAKALDNVIGMYITKVHKSKNPDQFSVAYKPQKDKIMGKLHKFGKTECLPIEKTIGGNPIATADMVVGSFLWDKTLNEYYLFHGTNAENVAKIFERGFQISTRRNTLYGNGIYLAEHAQKADQYSDDRTGANRRMVNLTMIICRALLGRSYVLKETGSGGPIKMPCFKRGCFTPGCDSHELCDSIVAGCDKNFREFLVLNEAQVIPMYAVTYNRRT